MSLILPPPERREAAALPAQPGVRLLRLAPRLLGPAMMLLCGLLLSHRIEPGFGTEVAAALAGVSPASWALAVAATAVSLWAVGFYDGILHRAAGTGVVPRRARRAGRRAIAIGQAVGFGAITGALVRWRCLPELGLVTLGTFSVIVSLSFIAALAAITGALALVVWGGVAGAALLVAMIAVARRLPVPRLPGLPRLRRAHVAGLLAWTLIDTVAAAVVLRAFLPAGIDIEAGVFLIAYLAALGAGMLSQSPGGLGAFELTLIALLPTVDPALLIAASLGYRLVYHIGPAIVAMATLIRPNPAPRARTSRLDPTPQSARARQLAAHPDWGLTAQGAGLLLSPGQRDGWMVRAAPGVLAAIGPARGAPDPARLADAARNRGLFPLLYKCTPREAARARRTGWVTMPVAREAVIDPATFCLDRPGLRRLRRKLRATDKAGLIVQVCPSALPRPEMAALNRDWAAAHGGERGFSMGRFCPRLIADQAVILGWHDGRLAGFVTFHRTGAGWGLDLMRHAGDAPAGTMQALVAAGIEAARREGAGRLSLAACPVVPRLPGLPGPAQALLARQRAAADGLTQFKSAFAPRWETRYAAAPDRIRLIAGLASVAWAVHHPGPPGRSDFRFEFGGPTCEASDVIVPRDIPVPTRDFSGRRAQIEALIHDRRPDPPA